MYTGKSDPAITRYYKTINGLEYINYNLSSWDGDNIIKDVKSPWAEHDHFIGTDASQSPPGLVPTYDGNNISIYISSLFRWGQAHYNHTITKFDMDVYVSVTDRNLFQSMYDNPDNTKYYMEYSGFLNLSSVKGAPLFISKNHFLDCSKNWS